MSQENKKKEWTTREQIDWLLDRISDERMLKRILTFINRLFVGGRV